MRRPPEEECEAALIVGLCLIAAPILFLILLWTGN